MSSENNKTLDLLIVHNINQELVNVEEIVCSDCGEIIKGEDEIIEQMDRNIEYDFITRHKGEHRFIRCKEIPASIIVQSEIIEPEIIEPEPEIIEPEITIPQLLQEARDTLVMQIDSLVETKYLTETGKIILSGWVSTFDEIITLINRESKSG